MGRLNFSVTVVFWLTAMSWLLLTKIFPVFDTSPEPLPGFAQSSTAQFERSCWEIQCQGKSIGYAASNIRADGAGSVTINSSLRLQKIPIGELLADLLGTWNMLAKWTTSIPADTEMSVATETEMEFTDGVLEHLLSIVDVDDLGGLFRLEGTRHPQGLEVRVVPGASLVESGIQRPLFSNVLAIPKDSLVVDVFAPYSQLANLRVGKRWQMRSYRAFPPGRPIRVIDAEVEGTEMLLWDGEIVNCHVVLFTEGETGTPTAAVTPMGRMWVDDDGRVLKQSTRLGGVILEFLRKPSAYCASKKSREALP